MDKRNEIINEVEEYYSTKIKKHGATSEGVDWNGIKSQELRFEQFERLFDKNEAFSVLDYGCGYGAMLQFLNKSNNKMDYTGFDISMAMIEKAIGVNGKTSNGEFVSKLDDDRKWDYVVASGLFNVQLKTNTLDWEAYIRETIDSFNAISIKGFGFNILTSYSDLDKMKDYLHYGDPLFYFDYCKKKYARNVSVLHDYDLYEFTILVKK